MPLTATIYNFEIDLADHDRQAYETLALRVARHPSESEEYFWTRVLAYALEFSERHRVLEGRVVRSGRACHCGSRSDESAARVDRDRHA